MTPRARELQKALESADPFESLRATVLGRMAEGTSRESVLGDLEDLRSDLSQEDTTEAEEVVMAVMDELVGFCSPQRSLARIGLSELDDPEAE